MTCKNNCVGCQCEESSWVDPFHIESAPLKLIDYPRDPLVAPLTEQEQEYCKDLNFKIKKFISEKDIQIHVVMPDANKPSNRDFSDTLWMWNN